MTGNLILDSALVLGAVGLFFGFLIAMVNKKFQVWEDPRIDGVEELLPSTNCGACGQPGCRGFAEAVVAGKVQPSGCTVMGAEDIADVAAYLGVDAGEANKRVARLLCAGGKSQAVQNSEYAGLETCKAAAAVAGGGKGCNWGCLGLADCEASCDFDAIFMNNDDLPVVLPELCTACGDCVEACPKDLFVLMPMEQKLIVQCKNLLKGDAAEDLCSVACNTCNRCVADSEPGVIEIIDNLAVINYEKNELTDPKAIERCPTGAIVWVEGQQFVDSVELEKKVS
ncbi:MAG: RnfABCDGE type electron transport complex subunit B [Xanthomonadales bacterium]|nr:RnfABCDGE type electron transport complex subunit B [Xanthomonadales bacterium]